MANPEPEIRLQTAPAGTAGRVWQNKAGKWIWYEHRNTFTGGILEEEILDGNFLRALAVFSEARSLLVEFPGWWWYIDKSEQSAIKKWQDRTDAFLRRTRQILQQDSGWHAEARESQRYYRSDQNRRNKSRNERNRIRLVANFIRRDIDMMVAEVLDGKPVVEPGGRRQKDYEVGRLLLEAIADNRKQPSEATMNWGQWRDAIEQMRDKELIKQIADYYDEVSGVRVPKPATDAEAFTGRCPICGQRYCGDQDRMAIEERKAGKGRHSGRRRD